MREAFGKKWFVSTDLVEVYHVNIDTVRRWCARGKWKGKAKKVANEWWVPEELVKEELGAAE